MSSASLDFPIAPVIRRKRRVFALAFVAGGAAALALMAPQAWSVWGRNTFLDPDDALRTVEIRDFLAGQSWFDTVAHRLSPDHPFPMHWSRLVDAPLGGLQRLFEQVLPVPLAERAMRITAPMLAFVAALFATLRLTLRTAGRRGLVPAALLFATAAQPMTNFLPGHIHHHGIQAALLLLAAACLVEAAGQGGRVRFATLGGALAMLSLGIGLQNLPFTVGLVAAALLVWVAGGMGWRRRLAGFGVGLLAAVPIFALDVPPGRYAEGACDAFSAAHLVAACATAGLCLFLAALTPSLKSVTARLVAGAAGGGAVLGLVGATFPHCLSDPMAGVDPLLRQAWLSGVGEALPLRRFIALSPWQGTGLLLTLLAGLGATALATWVAGPDRRARWAILTGLASIGFAGSLWEIRVAASTFMLLVPGVAWLTLQVYDRCVRHPGVPALLLAVCAGTLGNDAGWQALALPFNRSAGASAPDPAMCFDPDSYAALAALPSGLVLSTIDPGSTVLAYTSHTVLAAPYHRNTYGNRLSLLALAAPAEAARPLITEAGVRYVALCRTSNETSETISQHPESLSADLMAGRIPDWLAPVGPPGQVFVLFEVRRPPGAQAGGRGAGW